MVCRIFSIFSLPHRPLVYEGKALDHLPDDVVRDTVASEDAPHAVELLLEHLFDKSSLISVKSFFPCKNRGISTSEPLKPQPSGGVRLKRRRV